MYACITVKVYQLRTEGIYKFMIGESYIVIFVIVIVVQKSRLEGRGTETKESLQKRLDTAEEALQYGK